MRLNITAVFLLFLNLTNVNGANIMFYFGVSSYSHRIAIWPLVERLASSGHKITFVSPYPSKKPLPPQIKDFIPISLKTWTENWVESLDHLAIRKNKLMADIWWSLPDFGEEVCSVLMQDEKFIEELKGTKWDLFVVDSLANECAYGWVPYNKAKLIIFNTANHFPWYTELIGLPDESSWVPDQIYNPTWEEGKGLSFWDRVTTLLVSLRYHYIRQTRYFPKLESIIKEKLDPNVPSFSDIERNTSLLLVNHHPSEDFARPVPPNIISVGGLHIYEDNKEESNKLPKQLEEFIGNDPFIYVSFGTFVDIRALPEETRNEIIKGLNKLDNVKIIWRINIDRPEGLLGHVYTGKWMPQQALFAHPKIKAFVTHAGLLGIDEAIYNALPLVTIPVFGDQDYNANKVQIRKIGVKLELFGITAEVLAGAVNEILKDKEYAENMKKLSTKFRDRPMTALETANYWVEYVLKHDDTSHLRPDSVYLPWWKKRLLDIYASVFLITLLAAFLLFKVLRSLAFLLLSNKDHSTASKLKKRQ